MLVAAGAVAIALVAPTAIALPARWQSADASAQTWPTAWLDQAFVALAPDAVVLSWWSYSTPLWYGQAVEGRRPDVEVIDDQDAARPRASATCASVIDATIDHRPVYLIRVQESEIQALTDRFRIEPVGLPGNLYRVTGRKETSP